MKTELREFDIIISILVIFFTYNSGSIPASTPNKNQNAAQRSLPLILRHYKWDSANANTIPIKVVRKDHQAFGCYLFEILTSYCERRIV